MNDTVTNDDEFEAPLCAGELEDLAQGIFYIWQHSTYDFGTTDLMRGLKLPQYIVMGALRQRAMRMTELAELTNTSSANVTGMVDRLVERGLASREHDPSDRRVVLVSLTPLGTEELREQGIRFEKRHRHPLPQL